MELLQIKPTQSNGSVQINEPPFEPPYISFEDDSEIISDPKAFIEANTVQGSLADIKKNHIIPSFTKDGEPLISHSDFIESVMQSAATIFEGETILKPNIRQSHEIRGRIPSAKDKPSNQLLEHERTLFYERMAFVIEVPTIRGLVGGNSLSLIIGGVKSYNADNLYNRLGAEQHFKLFIGFQNSVCTNLCISTDGLMSNITVSTIEQLRICIRTLLEGFNYKLLLNSLETLNSHSLTEQQFANLIGRCRMYNFLPKSLQSEIPPMQFGENQLGSVVRDYYRDKSFKRNENGTISLWSLYNLLTGANKSSYIDSFADKAVNAFSFVYALKQAIDEGRGNWFLN